MQIRNGTAKQATCRRGWLCSDCAEAMRPHTRCCVWRSADAHKHNSVVCWALQPKYFATILYLAQLHQTAGEQCPAEQCVLPWMSAQPCTASVRVGAWLSDRLRVERTNFRKKKKARKPFSLRTYFQTYVYRRNYIVSRIFVVVKPNFYGIGFVGWR